MESPLKNTFDSYDRETDEEREMQGWYGCNWRGSARIPLLPMSTVLQSCLCVSSTKYSILQGMSEK